MEKKMGTVKKKKTYKDYTPKEYKEIIEKLKEENKFSNKIKKMELIYINEIRFEVIDTITSFCGNVFIKGRQFDNAFGVLLGIDGLAFNDETIFKQVWNKKKI